MSGLITHPVAIGAATSAALWVALLLSNYFLRDYRYNRATKAMNNQVAALQRERHTITNTQLIPKLGTGATSPEPGPGPDGRPTDGTARRGVAPMQTPRRPGTTRTPPHTHPAAP